MVQTMEELHDVYQHFLLYYGPDIPRMKAQQRQARRKAKEEEGEGGEDVEEDVQEPEGLKQAIRKTGYSICVQAGLGTYQGLVTYIIRRRMGKEGRRGRRTYRNPRDSNRQLGRQATLSVSRLD